MTIQLGTAALPAQAAHSSPPAASSAAPAFNMIAGQPGLTRLIVWAIGGTLLLAGVAVWVAAKRSNREPVSPARVAASAPSSSFWAPVAPQDIPAHEALSLPTGTWILRPHGARGRGVLKVQNGSDLDSAVRLVTAATPRKVLWTLYIRAHGEKETGGIVAGSYLLRFTLGEDWDAEGGRFREKAEFYQAGQQLGFTEREPTENEGAEYTELTVTLHEMLGGNLPRMPITEALFNEGQ